MPSSMAGNEAQAVYDYIIVESKPYNLAHVSSQEKYRSRQFIGDNWQPLYVCMWDGKTYSIAVNNSNSLPGLFTTPCLHYLELG